MLVIPDVKIQKIILSYFIGFASGLDPVFVIPTWN